MFIFVLYIRYVYISVIGCHLDSRVAFKTLSCVIVVIIIYVS